MNGAAISIEPDDPLRAPVRDLLDAHLRALAPTAPPESRHSLDHDALRAADVQFWTARLDGTVVGCAALRLLSPTHGEVKSMSTAEAFRCRGVAGRLLDHLIAAARATGVERLSLETGSQSFFAPAHRLYERHGFTRCGPFGCYREDVNSVFMTRLLHDG